MNRPTQSLRILLQPQAPGSFWVSNILTGINACAVRFGDAVSFPTPLQLEESPPPVPVLVVGNNLDWLEMTVEHLISCGIHPIVINACMIPGYHNRCSSVVFAVEDAVLELRQHLQSLGYKRIALVGVSPLSAADRIKCDAFGSPHDVFYADGCLEESIQRFVEDLSHRSYDAAICANDTAAICLYRELTRRGLRVPEDFAVTGMGNSYLGAALPVPLTSIDFDYCTLGDQAVRLFHSLLSNPSPCYESRALPCQLILRASTGAARIQTAENPAVPSAFDPVEGTLYYSGEEVQQILSLEAILQSCQNTDREILFALMRGESCEQIAQSLFFTPRAIRYRISRLTARFGLNSRAELTALLLQAAGNPGRADDYQSERS